MAERLDLIPPRLLERLMALQPLLRHSGSIVRRHDCGRKRVFRLRVRVPDAQRGRRQISVNVGGAEVARLVRDVIGGWRRERDESRTADLLDRSARQREARELRAMRRKAQQLAGGGRRRRRAVGRRFDDAVEAGGLAEYAFWLSKDCLRANRRPGRRRRSALTLVPS